METQKENAVAPKKDWMTIGLSLFTASVRAFLAFQEAKEEMERRMLWAFGAIFMGVMGSMFAILGLIMVMTRPEIMTAAAALGAWGIVAIAAAAINLAELGGKTKKGTSLIAFIVTTCLGLVAGLIAISGASPVP